MRLEFIPIDVVLTIHTDLVHRYGGRPGLRDRALLESALSQPQMPFGGKFIHKTIFDKAAAYGFHICRNHPFVGGNKRVALVLMDTFLQMNGWEVVAEEQETYAMVLDLASGKVTKARLARWVKAHSSKLPPR